MGCAGHLRGGNAGPKLEQVCCEAASLRRIEQADNPFMHTTTPPLELSAASAKSQTRSPALPRQSMPLRDYLKLDKGSRKVFRVLGGKVRI